MCPHMHVSCNPVDLGESFLCGSANNGWTSDEKARYGDGPSVRILVVCRSGFDVVLLRVTGKFAHKLPTLECKLTLSHVHMSQCQPANVSLLFNLALAHDRSFWGTHFPENLSGLTLLCGRT